MTPQTALMKISEHKSLTREEMLDLMQQIMEGKVSSVLISAIITGLKIKGESIDEIAASAQVMRKFSTKVKVEKKDCLIDTCGTGGDGASTFNISTLSAFVAAAAGVKVAKHGGRSVSSKCGSADLLEHLGADIMLSSDQVAECIDRSGIGFMFAPNHHSAMKYAAPVRKELGIRTMFNILGTLTNPAGAKRQLLGVFKKDLVSPLAEVLRVLGSEKAWVVHGSDGLDEITITGLTHVCELSEGEISKFTINPEDYGIKTGDIRELHASSPEQSKQVVNSVASGKDCGATDVVCLNAGAAIYISGAVSTMMEGVEKAREIIGVGLVKQKIEEFTELTHNV